MRKLDILTIEVGSTMTKANGFIKDSNLGLIHVAQGFSPTTVKQRDVSLGVDRALSALAAASNYSIEGAEIFVNSSAAGGLKMSVHGLTPSMTARAAKEASLGAGAIIKKLTAGSLSEFDIEEIIAINPNLILLAGGVDFGDSKTVTDNAEKLFGLAINAPIVYAGNVAVQKHILHLAAKNSREVWITENVFPAVDALNVSPVRRLIHEAFSKHIIHAEGMQKLVNYTREKILPTPGAVLLATQIFAKIAGDTVTIDVGGATTDVHSVTDGSHEFAQHLIEPEPREKRTVEGDLGVFVNAEHVLLFDKKEEWKAQLSHLKAIPVAAEERALTRWLCETAVEQGIKRHAGSITDLYTASGKKRIIKGKDLSAVRYLIGTGGALTKIEGGEKILAQVCTGVSTNYLLPPQDTKILLDKNYLFSALGTVAQKYEELVEFSLKQIFFK